MHVCKIVVIIVLIK